MRIDHVIWAARDLDAAARRFRDEHGLDSVAGGEHRGLGTANRIVPFGDDYVELMGVVDPAGPLAQWVLSRLGDRDGAWLGWCVATDDIGAVASRLGEEPGPMTRTRPDGVVLSWRLCGLARSMEEPFLPFFIQWDAPGMHPGGETAAHRASPRGIAGIEVAGDAERLRDRLGGAALPVRVTSGEPAVRGVTLAAAGDDIVIR